MSLLCIYLYQKRHVSPHAWESESKKEAIFTFSPKQLDSRGEEVKVEVRHTSTLLPDVAVQDTHCEGGWQLARAKRRFYQ